MVLKLDDKTVFIAHFGHIRQESKLWDTLTVCTIHVAPCRFNGPYDSSTGRMKEIPCGTEGAVSGIARCSRKDAFVKAKGRKLSFTRAISHMDRATRTRLWERYLEREGIVAKEVTA